MMCAAAFLVPVVLLLVHVVLQGSDNQHRLLSYPTRKFHLISSIVHHPTVNHSRYDLLHSRLKLAAACTTSSANPRDEYTTRRSESDDDFRTTGPLLHSMPQGGLTC